MFTARDSAVTTDCPRNLAAAVFYPLSPRASQSPSLACNTREISGIINLLEIRTRRPQEMDRLETVFRDDGDRELFLKTLGQACERTGCIPTF
jgi:hypothetical protein